MEAKICPVCDILQPSSSFYKNKARKDGLCLKCKKCSDSRVLELQVKAQSRNKKYRLSNIPDVLYKIIEFINIDYLNFDAFLLRCPYTFDELVEKNRLRDVKEWRQVGIVVKSLELNSWSIAGVYFDRNHATAIHSANVILNALEGYNDELKEKFLSVFSFDKPDVQKTLEIGLNESICLVQQENRIFDLLN
jgi:hypothetical protein